MKAECLAMIHESVSVFNNSREKPTLARADVWVQAEGCRNLIRLLSIRAATFLCFSFVYLLPKRVGRRIEGYVQS